ncbi:MAG: pyridoxal phosphate-dependent aminotransferase [Bacteroidia bacterium]|nr:pyridoxal phosphate-dependent aminotransferase [Bacteroidia bacterium]
MAENLIGSEIIKLAGEINEKIKSGEKIYNLTIGDFNPKVFPIPSKLQELIIEAYKNNETNYPPADGILDLRKSVSHFLQNQFGLSYDANEILISGGSRPLIYATYQTLVDPGDKIVFSVPSWNNNHYTHLSRAKMELVETTAKHNFLPTAQELAPHLEDANLLALCSPQNPTGTAFTAKALSEICDLVLAVNSKRSPEKKPLYLMYDQVYSALTFGKTKHVDPVSLRPEMRDYTIYIDGLSKSLAATGVRVGWAFGPKKIIDKMKNILGHVGAWSPKAEQVASAKFLAMDEEVNTYLTKFKEEIYTRLENFYQGFMQLKSEGFSVNAIAPQAAIYLTVEVNLKGKTTVEGKELKTTADATKYLLDEAKIGIVPFSAFGASADSTWYRISVGTCSVADISQIISNLRTALSKLK